MEDCLCLTEVAGFDSPSGQRNDADAGDNLRKVAERVLANRRQGLGDGADLRARLVTAQDPGTGARMSEA